MGNKNKCNHRVRNKKRHKKYKNYGAPIPTEKSTSTTETLSSLGASIFFYNILEAIPQNSLKVSTP